MRAVRATSASTWPWLCGLSCCSALPGSLLLQEPLFSLSILFPIFAVNWLGIPDHDFSGRDLIPHVRGMFLIAKSTREIGHEMEGDEEIETTTVVKPNVTGIIIQIIFLDIIFSFDSILTAVGLTDKVLIMIVAVIISIGIMMLFSGRISDFIHKHPSMEVLCFLDF